MRAFLLFLILYVPILQATPDTTPPTIKSLLVVPTVVDTGKQLTVTAHVTDDQQGVLRIFMSWHFYPYVQGVNMTLTLDESRRISGDAIDGIYQDTIDIGSDVSTGFWYLFSVCTDDIRRNQQCFRRDTTPSVFDLPVNNTELYIGNLPYRFYLPQLTAVD